MSRSARIGGVATLLVITLAVSAFRPVTRAPARAFAGKNTPQQTIISTTRSHATKYPDVIKLPHHDDPAITLHTNADTEEQDVLDSLIRRERFRKSFDSVMSKDRLLRKRVDSIEAVSIQRLRSNIHGVGLAWFTQPTDSTNRVSRQVNPNRLRYNLNPLTPLDYRSLRKPMDSINAVNTQIKELLKNLDNIRAEMEQIEQRLQSQANQR
jgi:hypothetical protein